MNFIKKYRSIPFVFKLLAGLLLGAIVGLAMGEKATLFAPLGTLFIRLLMMAALPLIFVNLMSAVASLNDPKLLGRIGLKISAYYFLTTAFAAATGIIVAIIMKPGSSFVLKGNYDPGAIGEMPSLITTLIGMVPKNIFAALSEGNLASSIVFSTFVGISIIMLKNKEDQELMIKGLSAITKTMFQLVKIILGIAPFGIFGLVADTVGKYGSSLMGFLLMYLGTIAVCVLIMMAIYSTTVLIFTKTSPFKFLKTIFPSIVTAFSTASSMASVPVNIECCKALNVPSKIYGFTIPLGAQINKDGLTIMLATACVAAGQAIGAPLDLGLIISMILMSILLTMGAGGVPGGSIVLITLIVTMFNFPAEVAGLIAGIFAPIEMLICVPNVSGDIAGTFIVAHSERDRINAD